MKKINKFTSILLVTVMALSLSACGNGSIPELIKPYSVAKITVNPEKGIIEDQLQFETYFEPEPIEITSLLEGNMYNCNYNIGDEIKKGEVILSINPNYDNDLAMLKANVEVAKKKNEYYSKEHKNNIANMEVALKSLVGYDRESMLLDIKAMKLNYEKDEKEAEAQYNELLEKYNDLVAAKESLNIIAPEDGIITFLPESEWINKNQTVCVIQDCSNMILKIDYLENEVVDKLNSISVDIKGKTYNDIEFVPYTDEELAEINAFGLDKKTMLKINGLDESVEFGDLALINIKYNTSDECMFIPIESVKTDKQTKEKYVYCMDDSGKEVKKMIEVGRTTLDKAEVLSGLDVNDKVYYQDDVTPIGKEIHEYEVKSGDFIYDELYGGGYLLASESIDLQIKIAFIVTDIYYDVALETNINEGDPIVQIKPVMSELEIEKAKNDYDSITKEYSTYLDNKKKNIDKALNSKNKGESVIERLNAELTYNELTLSDDSGKIKDFEEKIKEAKKIYEFALAAEKEENVDILAPASGLLSFSKDTVLIIDKQYSTKPVIAKIDNKATYTVKISDIDETTRKSGNIKFNNKLTIISDNNKVAGTAIVTNSNPESTNEVIIKLDNIEDIDKLSIKNLKVLLPKYSIKDATLISSDYLYYEPDVDGAKYYVFLKYGEGIIKKYVDVCKVASLETNDVWIRSGLSVGDIIVKY